uniref:uncharacterized protein LOC105349895 n=1 Tax=Fragaria vesca subsp. vesca TaxID=101020 RepID=UPI0005C8271D|nr:PREDICTED: uncharacterized protein LOC105349895 [Fragaria vesca subsp. vesca]
MLWDLIYTNLTAYDEAFSRTSRFHSDRPFLALKLHSSYIANPLNIQESFVHQYVFQGHLSRSVNLQIPNGGTWCAKCTVSRCGEHDYARIHGGWTKFARDNDLQGGDVIVIDLIQQQPEVHIYRSQISKMYVG